MHLKREQITTIAEHITRNLRDKGVAVFKVGEDKIRAKIEAIIAKDQDAEAAIETEVKRVMEQYKTQIATGQVDAQKIFMMIKKQVAKERKFIL